MDEVQSCSAEPTQSCSKADALSNPVFCATIEQHICVVLYTRTLLPRVGMESAEREQEGVMVWPVRTG